jgi:hypothetical protein
MCNTVTFFYNFFHLPLIFFKFNFLFPTSILLSLRLTHFDPPLFFATHVDLLFLAHFLQDPFFYNSNHVMSSMCAIRNQHNNMVIKVADKYKLSHKGSVI